MQRESQILEGQDSRCVPSQFTVCEIQPEDWRALAQKQSQNMREDLRHLPTYSLHDGAKEGVGEVVDGSTPRFPDYTKPGLYRLGDDQTYARTEDDTEIYTNGDDMLVVSNGKIQTIGNVEVKEVDLEVAGMKKRGTKVTFDDGNNVIIYADRISAIGNERFRRAIAGNIPRDL